MTHMLFEITHFTHKKKKKKITHFIITKNDTHYTIIDTYVTKLKAPV